MANQVNVVNQALELIAAQTTITSLTDGSPAANAAKTYYTPTVLLVLRELDPMFARKTAALVPVPVVSPIPPWSDEYTYPSDCVRVRQVRPAAGAYDLNDPPQVLFQIAFDTVAAAPAKVILANIPNALAVYTTAQVVEANWDDAFAEAVARRLANPLGLALSGRPDLAREMLEEADRYSQLAETIDEG